MSEHTYKFNVAMSCGGCSGAITRVLNKLDGKYTRARTHRHSQTNRWHQAYQHPDPLADIGVTGVKSFDVSLDNQTAEVITADDALSYEKVLTTIKKTGKQVKTGEADGKEMPIELQE